MRTNYTHQQLKLSKWLLPLLVFLGVFVFSGSVSNVQSGQHRAVQTEQHIGKIQRQHKKHIAYYKFNTLHKIEASYPAVSKAIVAICHYRLLQTKLRVLRYSYSNWGSPYFSPLKTITQHAKEVDLAFLLG